MTAPVREAQHGLKSKQLKLYDCLIPALRQYKIKSKPLNPTETNRKEIIDTLKAELTQKEDENYDLQRQNQDLLETLDQLK